MTDMSANKIFKSEPKKVDDPNKNVPSPEDKAVKFEKRKDRSYMGLMTFIICLILGISALVIWLNITSNVPFKGKRGGVNCDRVNSDNLKQI